MGFRFRKYVRRSKDGWMNLSKQGAYLSICGHGLTTDVSKEGRQHFITKLGPVLC
jgi:hypothetical protein